MAGIIIWTQPPKSAPLLFLNFINRPRSARICLIGFAFADETVIAQKHRHLRALRRTVFAVVNPRRIAAQNDRFVRRDVLRVITDGFSIRRRDDDICFGDGLRDFVSVVQRRIKDEDEEIK